MTITTDDNLGFYTPTHATQAEEDSAIAMIRDGAWVPVASGYGDADGFVSPAFLEVCEDAANQQVRDEAAWNDERRELEAEADGLRDRVRDAKGVISSVPDDADASTMDAALIEALSILEG